MTGDNPQPLPVNQVRFSGQLIERKVLRYTPAGVPVSEFRISHESEQIESGLPRRVECELAVVALGVPARLVQELPLGASVRIEGFLAARSRNSRQPTLHVNTIEFVEGNENAETLQA